MFKFWSKMLTNTLSGLFKLRRINQPPLEQINTHITEWLHNPVCFSPCWENIIPGQTTLSQALTSLTQNPIIVTDSIVSNTDLRFNYGYVRWKWVGCDYGGSLYYTLNDASKIVYSIEPTYRGVLKLGNIKKKFGEPTHIKAHSFYGRHGDGPFYTFELVYANYGLRLTNKFTYRFKPRVNNNLKFTHVKFYSLEKVLNDRDVSWQGFRDFVFYCRDKDN